MSHQPPPPPQTPKGAENSPPSKRSAREALLNVKLVELVTFRMGNEDYAFFIQFVDTIIPVQAITRVPKSVGYIKGVINLRGEVIPVIDLRNRLNFELRPIDENTKIMILYFPENKAKAGIIVDSVSEVVKLPEKDISRPQSNWNKGGLAATFISAIGQKDGVGKSGEPHRQLIIVLDGEAVVFGKKTSN